MRLPILCLIVTLLIPGLVHGQELPKLPAYTPCEWKGEQAACFDLEGYKQLLELEALAQKLYQQSALDASMIAGYQEVIKGKDEQLQVATKLNKVLVTAYTEQTEALKKEIAEKNRYKYRPFLSLDSPVPYLLLGGVVALAGGVVIGLEL